MMASAAETITFAWQATCVMVFAGQSDTHIHTGEDYETRTLGGIFSMRPDNKPKGKGLAFIPSTYCGHDGRAHKVQQDQGSFVALTGDVDKGDHPPLRIKELVTGLTNGAAHFIYSSAHSRPGNRRWRIILPLATPVDFATWHDAQNAFFDAMEAAGVTMDRALARAGQPVYLPNVPAVHVDSGELLRNDEGQPLYYQRSSLTEAPGLSLDQGPIANAIAGLHRRRLDDEELRKPMRAEAERRKAKRTDGGGESLIDGFNRANSLPDLLASYGYEQSPRNEADWRSPHQTGGTFATRVVGDKWVSLSGSDADAGVGARCKSGCYGDGFDLFVHYEHKGDYTTALRSLAPERGLAANDTGWDREDGDPGPQPEDFDLREPNGHRRGESTHMREGFNPVTGDTIDPPRPAEPFPLANLSEWAQSPAVPKSFILAGRIPKHEITLLTGDGGANKSTFGQQLATCRAAGKPFLGLPVEPGPSLYVTAEDDFDRLQWMHEHICTAIGSDLSALEGRLHLASVRGLLNNELATFDHESRIRPTPAFGRLKQTIKSTKADLLVLDNVAHMFAGNENDRSHVTAFVNLLYGLCRHEGVTVVLIAHRNKAGDSYSGSTAWLNAVRSQLVLERSDTALNPDDRDLSVGKANYARPDEKLQLRWHEFALWPRDQLPTGARSEMDELIWSNGAVSAFMRCLREREKQGTERAVGPAPGPNYAPTQFERMAEAKGYKKDKLARAMEQLFALGQIETHTYRNKAKSRDVTIIREVAGSFPNSFPNPSRTLIPNAPEPAEKRTHTHTTIDKSISGAATRPAAPDDELDWRSDGEGDD